MSLTSDSNALLTEKLALMEMSARHTDATRPLAKGPIGQAFSGVALTGKRVTLTIHHEFDAEGIFKALGDCVTDILILCPSTCIDVEPISKFTNTNSTVPCKELALLKEKNLNSRAATAPGAATNSTHAIKLKRG